MFKRIALGALLFTTAGCAVGCAGGYKVSYVTGAVTKQFATESYNIYSEQAEDKKNDCSPANNKIVRTQKDLDKCLGAGFKRSDHDKIEIAAEAYYEATAIHTQVMLAVNGTVEERRVATEKIFEAALNMLSILPNGDKLVNKLKKLTGRR